MSLCVCVHVYVYPAAQKASPRDSVSMECKWIMRRNAILQMTTAKQNPCSLDVTSLFQFQGTNSQQSSVRLNSSCVAGV